MKGLTMNRMKIISVATLLAMGVATAASAQGSRYDQEGRAIPQTAPRPNGSQYDQEGRGYRPAAVPGGSRYDQEGRALAPPVGRYDRPGFDRPGPDRAWQRGDRLPPEYRGRQYVVDDWRGHRLSAPPRGYHWVQHGNDYVLAAIATGVIASVLLNH